MFFLFITSCHKEESIGLHIDSNGVLISLPYQWKKSLHLNGVVSNSRFKAPIYYNENIAIPTTNGANNRLMTLINPNNGDTIWSWDDRYQPETEDVNIKYPYQYNNLLTYQKNDRSYCINLDDGTTQWKFRRDVPFDVRLYPSINPDFFFYNVPIVNTNGYKEYAFYQCAINNGDTNEFVRANYSGNNINPDNMIGAVTHIIKVPNSSHLYAITYMEPSPIWVVNSYLGLYNATTQQWVYERKLMAPPTINSSAYEPKIYSNKVYAWVGKNMVCHDLNTGNQLWIKPFPQDFLFSGFIIKEDKIIATNEDGFTYALNPIDGTILWKTKTSGTSGRMSYLNGIVYFVGGASGKLHALDINTGAHVWKIDASRLGEQDNNNFKTNAVYVFPATNGNPAKVIALSHLYAYSFEAYQ